MNSAVMLSAPPQALAWRIAAGVAARTSSWNSSVRMAPESHHQQRRGST